jgi:hypothetical protein
MRAITNGLSRTSREVAKEVFTSFFYRISSITRVNLHARQENIGLEQFADRRHDAGRAEATPIDFNSSLHLASPRSQCLNLGHPG